MARISNYPVNDNLSLDDRMLGTNKDPNDLSTEQFILRSVMALFDEARLVASVYTIDGEDTDETTDGYFTTVPTDSVIGTTTELKINKTSSSGIDLSSTFDLLIDFINTPGTILRAIIKNSEDSNNFGYFTISAVTDSTTHYIVALSIINNISFGNFINNSSYLFIPEFKAAATVGDETTDSVSNVSDVPGSLTTDALNNLKAKDEAQDTVIAANSAKISYTDAVAVAANSAKISYTDAVVVAANTAKISYTDAVAVAANSAKRSYPVGDEAKLITIDVNAEVNSINSTVTGEPTGSIVIPNKVKISQANYDAAVIAGTTVATTEYSIV